MYSYVHQNILFMVECESEIFLSHLGVLYGPKQDKVFRYSWSLVHMKKYKWKYKILFLFSLTFGLRLIYNYFYLYVHRNILFMVECGSEIFLSHLGYSMVPSKTKCSGTHEDTLTIMGDSFIDSLKQVC